MDVTVRNNTKAGSYEAVVDGDVVGMIIYASRDNRIIFRSTVVDEQMRGNGIATTLVRQALDDVAAHGHTLTNYCGFVTTFIARHPEYAALLDRELPGMTLAGQPKVD